MAPYYQENQNLQFSDMQDFHNLSGKQEYSHSILNYFTYWELKTATKIKMLVKILRNSQQFHITRTSFLFSSTS